MRPGQLTANDLETAVIERIAVAHPAIQSCIGELHVLSREFTGVGSYTNFRCDSAAHLPREPMTLKARIAMPGVPNGLGAVLFCRGGYPTCLEIFTYGDETWDGRFEGYSIVAAT